MAPGLLMSFLGLVKLLSSMFNHSHLGSDQPCE